MRAGTLFGGLAGHDSFGFRHGYEFVPQYINGSGSLSGIVTEVVDPRTTIDHAPNTGKSENGGIRKLPGQENRYPPGQ